MRLKYQAYLSPRDVKLLLIHSAAESCETDPKVRKDSKSSIPSRPYMRRINNGETTVVWIHFLAVVPPGRKSGWVKSGLVLKWSPTPKPSPFRRITLICFQPLPGVLLAVNRLFKSHSWTDVLNDPYFLINMAFEAWHELIDDNAWKLLDVSREVEKVC
jgi:hypothetical protein